MKTFFMNIPSAVRNFKNNMDIKSVLCDRPWNVFNDESRKIVFIFQRDNSLIISDNGIVSDGTWQFVSANSALIVKTKAQSVMFHPTFVDDFLFVLQQDGCQKYMLMVDEEKNSEDREITFDALNNYLCKREEIFLSNHETEKEREEREFRQREEAREKDAFLKNHAKEVELLRKKYLGPRILVLNISLVVCVLGGFMSYILYANDMDEAAIVTILVSVSMIIITFFLKKEVRKNVIKVVNDFLYEKRREEWGKTKQHD